MINSLGHERLNKMKFLKTTLFTILSLFILLINCEKSKEPVSINYNSHSFLKENSMNLAILIVDFNTYQFEGGTINYNDLCDSCDTDSLPFSIDFIYPCDFGSIAFKYTHTGDTLFFATTVWHGMGQIIYPDTFLSPNSFRISQNSIIDPSSIEYFFYDPITLFLADSTLKVKADSAWNSVKHLDITMEFSNNQYRVGIYLYPPSVGLFIPDLAKWIIFLYCRKD